MVRVPFPKPTGDEMLDEITKTIVERFNPEKIFFFGSRAQGKATEESDIDLLVVLDAPVLREVWRDFSHKLSRKTGFRVQIIPMTKNVYEETKNVVGGIAYPATKYGVVLYEKS